MIWLKEDEKVVGYVPILKKQYSEEEIWKMNKYSLYQGWSELAKIVMQIQGIKYINANPYTYYEFEAKRNDKDLCNLQNIFSANGYKLSHSLFESPDELLRKQLYAERAIKTELVMPRLEE